MVPCLEMLLRLKPYLSLKLTSWIVHRNGWESFWKKKHHGHLTLLVLEQMLHLQRTCSSTCRLLGINHALGVSMGWRVCVACVARARRVRVCVQAFMAFRSLGLFVS